ncbi:MAG: hypothetical protein KF832_05890 [Caldilineaceae bacterium]|nr:hypothetical protein [Caldilineaceae bacterium]
MKNSQLLPVPRFFNKLLSATVILAMTVALLADFSVAVRAQTADATSAPPSASQDAYESADACSTAAALTANGPAQQRKLVAVALDQDWAKIEVTQGKHYQLQVGNAGSDLRITLHTDCGPTSLTATRTGMIEFTATRDATYYVQIEATSLQRAITDYQLQLIDQGDRPASVIKLADVPIALHRRAADFLEGMRGSPLAPDWAEARLADEVRTILRPDLDGVAYYEFPVEKPGAQGFEPAGFIQVSAGDHDYPITHWDVSGDSPTKALDTMAEEAATTTSQYFKLDVLSYMAEHEELSPLGLTLVATDVIQLGTMPPKLIGLDELPLSAAQELTTEEWKPSATITDDLAIDPDNPVTGTLEIDGPEEPHALSQETWDSWALLKQEYRETYGTFLDGLKNDAADEWEAALNTEQYGEGLVKDDVRIVRALATQTLNTIQVVGEGASSSYLQQEEVKENDVLVGVKLTVIDVPAATSTSAPLSVTLNYAGGTSEIVKFVINQAEANQLYLPMVTTGDGNNANAAALQSTSLVQGNWGPWTYWWAGSHNDQRLYDQIAANSFNNNFPCWSGCGATAWAMLFGWADHQAALNNPVWRHRNGIYRQNGGYGADADAPRTMDAGIRNMTMEIRGYIGTYCNNGGGWTQSSTMGRASTYLNGRSGATTRSLYANGWWIFGTSEEQVRDRAISAIQSGRPVIIGRDSHFPLAYGYAQQTKRSCFLFFCSTDYNRWFYVNQGWGGSSNGWVTASAWFAGEVLPN